MCPSHFESVKTTSMIFLSSWRRLFVCDTQSTIKLSYVVSNIGYV